MARWSEIAAIRFGTGLSPAASPPASAADLLDDLADDPLAAAYPVMRTPQAMALGAAFAQEKKAAKDDPGAAKGMGLDLRQAAMRGLAATLARGIAASTGFRERLTWFWAGHFTVAPRNAAAIALAPAFVEDAIRPHVSGRFADMLRAAVTHPAMILYLDQARSMGPNSQVAALRGGGLNENLAREVLELHTLGVGGGYTQEDVRQFAELLTGLSVSEEGMQFRPRMAEPGPETILGRRWGGDPARIGHIAAFLDDLAVRPETARHVARRLAVHFTADEPDAALVGALADRFMRTGGDLPAVYEVLIGHRAAIADFGAKVRQPFDLIVAALRALGAPPDQVAGVAAPVLRRAVTEPLKAMGQPWMQAPGPDGWPEEAAAWITPPRLSARIDWAMQAPRRLVDPLPDPREFVGTALGGIAGEALGLAASRAESPADGVGLVLASPAFNRR